MTTPWCASPELLPPPPPPPYATTESVAYGPPMRPAYAGPPADDPKVEGAP